MEADENIRCVAQRRRSPHGTVNGYSLGAGASGTSNCCFEHDLQTLHDEAPLGDTLTDLGRCLWKLSFVAAPVWTFIRPRSWPAVVACVRVSDGNRLLAASVRNEDRLVSRLHDIGLYAERAKTIVRGRGFDEMESLELDAL
jgi:hypothetical protein